MLQKIFSALLFLGASLSLSAQNNNVYTARRARDIYGKAPAYVGVYAHYSTLFNTQLFETDYSSLTAGFANQSGWGGGVRGAYFFNGFFGLGGTAFYNFYETRKASTLAEGYLAANGVDSCTVFQKGNYEQIGGLIGPVFTLQGETISFDVHAFGGMINTTTPEMSVFLRKNTAPSLVQSKATAMAFGWQAGATMRIHLSELMTLALHADYTTSQPNFTFENTASVGFLGRRVETYNQSITNINAGIGVYAEIR